MFYRTDDPLADFNRHEEDLEKAYKDAPTCCYCGERIQDAFAFHIDQEWFHEECMRSEYYVEVV